MARINTLYGCKTTIVFTLKMESVPKITILSLKTMVKSGLKNHFEIPPCGKMVILVTVVIFYEMKCIRIKWLSHGGISKTFFLAHFSPSFLD